MKSAELWAKLKAPEVSADGEICGLPALPAPDESDEDEEEFENVSSEDFDEALDLLYQMRDIILETLTKYRAIAPGRRRKLQGTCDDVGQFLSNFVELENYNNKDL